MALTPKQIQLLRARYNLNQNRREDIAGSSSQGIKLSPQERINRLRMAAEGSNQAILEEYMQKAVESKLAEQRKGKQITRQPLRISQSEERKFFDPVPMPGNKIRIRDWAREYGSLVKKGAKKGFDYIIQSEKAFGQTLGDALAVMSKDVKEAQKAQVALDDMNVKLAKAIIAAKKKGKDTTRLEDVYKRNTGQRFNLEEIVPSTKKSAKQIYGEGLGVAVDIASFGQYGQATKGAKSLRYFKPSQIRANILAKPLIAQTKKQAFRMGAKKGALRGGVTGLARGAAGGMIKDKEIGGIILESGLTGLAGTAIGWIAGGLTERHNFIKQRDKFLADQLKAKKQEIAKQLKSKTISKLEAKREIVRAGAKPVDILDEHQETVTKAVNRGIDKKDIRVMLNATDEDKKIMKKMYTIARDNQGTRRVTQRPIAEAGKTILKRVKHIADARKTIGAKLGETVKKMPKKKIDITDIYDDFIGQLDDAGIKIKKDGILSFRDSRISGSTGSAARTHLQAMYNDLKPNKLGKVFRTPQKINVIRQRWFDDLSLAKQQQVLSVNTTRILTKARENLDKPLTKLSDNYKQLTTDYAKTSDAIKSFYDLIGKKWSGKADDIVALRAGEVGNRVLGNAQAVPLEVLDKLERTALQTGFKAKTDVVDQILFADFLEDLFGTTQTRSLRGQVGRGLGDAAEAVEAMKDVSKKNVLGIITKGYNLIKSRTPEAQQKVIEMLLDIKPLIRIE